MKTFWTFLVLCFLATPALAQWQVAIFPYENQTRDPQWDWISRGISESLMTAFYRVPRIRVIDETPLQHILGENWQNLIGNATWTNQAQIHIVLSGDYVVEAQTFTVRTRIIEADNGKIRRTITNQATLLNPFEALCPVATALIEELNVPIDPPTQKDLLQVLQIDPHSFQTTMEGVQTYRQAIRESSPDHTLLTQAEQGLKRAINQTPQNALAYDYLGQIYEKRSQMAEAEQAYRQAIQADSLHVGARYHLSVVLKKQGRISETLIELEQALSQSPIDPDIQRELSGLFFAQQTQTFETATKKLQEHIQTNPDDPLAYYDLGSAYDELYRFDEASQYYQQALERDSTLADAHYKLGLIQHRKGNHEEAVQHLYRAIAHHTQLPRVHFRLGDILYLLERFQEAAEQYALSLQIEPTYQIPCYHLGLCQRSLDETNAAYATFLKYIELITDDHRPYYELGEIYRQRNQIDQAIQHHQKAIDINPTYIPPRYQLDYLYAEQKDYAQAVKALQIVLRLQPDHPQASNIQKDIERWKK